MKYKYTIWLLCGLLTISIAANIRSASITFEYYDDLYEELAKQHLLNSRLKVYLEQSDIEAAKQLLDKEIETKGSALAICLMEGCSKSAERVMNGNEN